MNKKQEQVWETITSLNKLWTSEGSVDELSKFFHQDVIALVSKEKKRVYGKDACAAHWKSCSENKIIHSWKEHSPAIHLFEDGKFATVMYEFDISLERNGESVNSHGRDLFSLIFEDNKWQVVAATV